MTETTKKHSVPYRIARFSAFFFLWMFAIILLIFGLVNLPVTQKFLSEKASSYLSETLNTEVRVGHVGWKLPKQAFIRDVYMETPAGDSLFTLGSLEVGIGIFGLLRQKVQIDYIGLTDVTGNVYIRQDTSNIAFITDAFMPTDTSVVEKAPNPAPTGEPAAPWEILFTDATLDLRNVDVLYDDQPTGIRLDLQVGDFSGTIGDADLTAGKFYIDELSLQNSAIDYLAYPVAPDTTAATVLDYDIRVGNLNVGKTDFSMRMDSLQLFTHLEAVTSTDINARLSGDSIGAQVAEFDIRDSEIKYDLVGTPELSTFDPNHFHFTELNTNLTSFEYDNLDVETVVNELAAKAGEDFTLESTEGTVVFNRQGVALRGFALQTGRSSLAESNVTVAYDFLASELPPLESMGLDIQIPEGSLAPADVLYFSPELAPYFAQAKENLKFTAEVKGSLQDLQLENVEFTGFDSELRVKGEIGSPMDVNRLSMDLNVERFTSRGAVINGFLPPNTLPAGTELPAYLTLTGNVSGELNRDLFVEINARTTPGRDAGGTQVDLNGNLSDVMTDSLAYDLTIDRFTSTEGELSAFMPDNILPVGYRLPTSVDLRGKLAGTLNSVQPDLILKAAAPGGRATVQTKGAINDFNNPRLNFQLLKTQIDTAFLTYILPDSLLPAEIRLPNIESGTADIKGTLAALNADLNVKTSAGDLIAEVKTENEVYNFNAALTKLNLLKVTDGALYDTLARTNLDAINVNIKGTGKNLDSLEIATANADLVIKEINSKYPGMVATVDLKPEGVIADISFDDIAGKANLKAFSDLKNRYTAAGRFTDFDFKDIPYVRYPIVMDGLFDVKARYDSLADMTADVILNEFNFRYNKEDYPLNRMQADVDFLGLQKDVVVRSDWVDADVKGKFDFAEISTELTALVDDYLREGSGLTRENPSDATMTASAQWKNTAILTSGIVPGLEEIEPFDLRVRFAAAEDDLAATLNFPKIVYSGVEMNNLTGDASTGFDVLNYQFKIAQMQISGAGNMGEVTLQGGVNDGLLEAHLINTDTTGATRLDITALADNEDEKYRLRFKPAVTLNNDPWQFSPQNEIIYAPEGILVTDWRLSNGKKQSLSLESVSAEQIQATFGGFRIEEVLAAVQMEEYGGGAINGTVTVDNPLGDFRVDANLAVEDTQFYGSPMGYAQIDVNNRQRADRYDVDFALSGAGNQAKIGGFVDLGNPVDALNINLDVQSLKLKPFEPFLEGVANNLHGVLVADAQISGTPAAPSLVGYLQAKDAGITVDQLGAPLDFGEQKIELDGNAIRFRNFEIVDSTGSTAMLNAFIITENFYDFEYDLDVKAENFMVMDTQKGDNELYYGTMIVDATAQVSGDLYSPVIEATASPRKGSDLTYVMPASSASVDYGEGVVVFTDGLGNEEEEIMPGDTVRSQIAQALNMTMVLNLEMNDNLEFTAVIDPVMNNYFEGKGEGFLTFTMYPSGEMEMSGTFTMKEGVYNFVYAELVKRKFDVVAGSSLSWTGDIYNPSLDIKVQYKIKASPAPLIGQETAPVQTFFVRLDITGTLEKTDIATSILYPDLPGNTGNSEVESALNTLAQNSNRMNEQAFGLILFNNFVSQGIAVNADILNAQGSISEAITGQLNTIANQYIKFVELDFGVENFDNYDANGQVAGQTTNVNVTVRKRFFQDRLVVSIDGETSSSSSNNSSQTAVYLDNLTVEYSLTKSGNYKVRVYNKRDNNDPLAPDVLRTGGALVISKDFNELRLFNGGKKQEKTEE